MFFPEKGQSHLANEVFAKFCISCPVLKECDDYRKRTSSSGLWAGKLHIPYERKGGAL